MTSNAPADRLWVSSQCTAAAPVDVVDALDLLSAVVGSRNCGIAARAKWSSAVVVDDQNVYALDGEPWGIVGHALALGHVSVERLESMRGQALRDLYRDGRMPIPVTLGALIVLDAAQRSQHRGNRGDEVLDDATAAASRMLDLVSVLPDVTRRCSRFCAIRCGIFQPQDYALVEC